MRSAGQQVHRHVAAAAEGRRELLQHQEDLAIIGAGIVLRLDVDRPGLAGVGAAVEVAAGHDMRVVEAEARRLWHEGDPLAAVRRHERRAFLGRAVHVARDHLPVPVDQFRRVGVVVDIDHDALAFLEAQQRSGKLAVIERRRDDVVGRKLDQSGCDAQRVVRLGGGDLVGRACDARRRTDERQEAGMPEQGTALDHHGCGPPIGAEATRLLALQQIHQWRERQQQPGNQHQ